MKAICKDCKHLGYHQHIHNWNGDKKYSQKQFECTNNYPKHVPEGMWCSLFYKSEFPTIKKCLGFETNLYYRLRNVWRLFWTL